jgi:epoxyqueuosine reductase QueG
MVCFGLPVPRAVYDVELHPTETVWRAQNMYYKRLDMLSLRFAQLLEECGARALPAFGCYPMALNKRGEVAGYLNMLRMGECTGIGTLGRNGLLLNSRYGARLMLGGLITTAELPVTRNVTTPEPGCPAGCRVCIDACPVGAISEKKGRVRIMRCAGHAARTPFMPRLRFGLMTKLNPEAAARFINQRAFDEHTTHVCSRCVSRCPYGE